MPIILSKERRMPILRSMLAMYTINAHIECRLTNRAKKLKNNLIQQSKSDIGMVT